MDVADRPLWRQALKIGGAFLATASLFLGAALFLDGSALRVLLGITPELDVPYIATRQEMIDTMLDLAEVGPDDRVVDLGTGDGRILISAAKDRGATGLGVDLDPAMIATAKANAVRAGISDRVSFAQADLFETSLEGADVVTMYLLPSVNLRLRPRLLEQLEPGSRIVSHAFDMGDWRPNATGTIGSSRSYLWIVPADVDGQWQFQIDGDEFPVIFAQQFQDVEGTAQIGSEIIVLQPELEGDRLRFSLPIDGVTRNFEGIVRGERIVPVGTTGWAARRSAQSRSD